MDTNKMRDQVAQQFEAFYTEYERKRDANGWMPLDTHVVVHMRNAFVASREAVVVELPRSRADAGEKANGDQSLLSALMANHLAIEQCKEAIEAQGLRVTP
ncbi:hypothetical protein [Pseudomonas putida]|uniref:Uncharacterized protein n=1 Tax=Pseudomonas putida TaxID=303 RepID=A0A1X0ZM96_PSEPU|nr:hypothetical protein [Pseudomonas putida]ORL58091.1 hypothetical protein B7H17_26200 [Pseudomonas putida]